MWKEVMEKFEGSPSQKKVIELLLERGFQVTPEGKVASGRIEIAHTQIANEIGVDRRVVDMTVKRILAEPELKKIFENIRSIAFLAEVAPLLGLSVVIIHPKDAKAKGILGEVATVMARRGLSIRQAVSDDPYLVDAPKLTIITDKNIPGELIEEIGKLKSVKGVQIQPPT
ncbi:MAG TPA: amino acid-binding protein [Candidatus Bathyarchaeia archaeon]|nr:amino acid-binding protein [Candidatus Bathyarchaeia archaeon]